MLAVFFGTDRAALRDGAAAFLAKNVPHVSAESVDDTTYEHGKLASLANTQSLFGGIEAYILDTPSNDTEFETEVTENLAEFEVSPHVFVVLESRLLAAAKKKYERHATVVEEYVAEKIEQFNAFALAEAVAKRDKKGLWVLLQEAKMAGLRAEEIIGMLWWQLKTLRLAAMTDSSAEAGLKDYPYKKAKGALRHFKSGEVESLSNSLLTLYHDGHQGKADMELKLEEWALSL